MSGTPVVEARGLTRDLGEGASAVQVLSAIDLTIDEGEFVAITGPSGSGKSTLLYLLGALDRPTRGEVLIDGVAVGQMDDDERAALRSEKLGFVFQFHFLLPEFSTAENVAIPLRRRGVRRDEAHERARVVLERLGMAELTARRPHQLSGGQQQRVAIARALAARPRVCLADEPTGNLDSANGALVMDLFERVVREDGITVIMVTHERSFAARASREIVLRDGRVLTAVGAATPAPGTR